MINRLLTIGAILIALFLQLFIFPYLPLGHLFNIFFATTVILLLLGKTAPAIIGGTAGGLLMDLTLPLAYGTALLGIVSTLMLVRWISRTRITNRSFTAYQALLVIGLLAFAGSQILGSALLHLVDTNSLTLPISPQYLATIFWQTVTGLIFGSLVYFAVRLSGRNYAKLAEHDF